MLWLVGTKQVMWMTRSPLLWRNNGMNFFPLLFSLTFTVIHIYLLTETFVRLFLSFWYTHLAKSKPWLNPSCASALFVLFQLNKAGKNVWPWRKVITINFKWALLFPNNHTVCPLIHSLSPLLEDDFITCYQMAQTVKRLPAMWETQVRSLDRDDPLEKEMATHSSTFAWKIPQTEEPGMLQSMGLNRVRHDWVTSLSLYQTPNSLPSSCFLFHRIPSSHLLTASICTHIFSFSFCYHRWIIDVPL